EAVDGIAEVGWTDVVGSLGGQPAERRLNGWGLGCDAGNVEHCHRTGRGGSRTEGPQLIFGGVVDTDDERTPAADALSEQMAERRKGGVSLKQAGGHVPEADHDSGATPSVGMKANVRHDADDGCADVDKVAVALGPGAEHAVGKDDGVRLGPGNLLTESG